MNRLLIGILAIFTAIAVYLAFKQDKISTLDESDIAFAIGEDQKVDKIVLKDRDGNTVKLSLTEGIWYVNDEYPAFEPFVTNFIDNTLRKIEIKGPVAEAAKQNVIRSMVGDAIRVDIWNQDELIRSYYVGAYTPDMKGSYMHMKGSESPFVTYIPGFDGYLSPRYNLEPDEWFDRTIFDFEAEEIREVEMQNLINQSESFKIIRKGESLELTPYTPSASESAIKSYLALFTFKNFEGFPEYLEQAQQDSIAHSAPLMKLKVKTTSKEIELLVFKKGNDGANTLIDKKGNLLTYDPERYFATFTGFDRLVTIQDHVFNKILVNRSDFK